MKETILRYLRARAKNDPDHAELIDNLADTIEDMPVQMYAKQKYLEPLLVGGVVTREVLRCSNCKEEAGLHDRYCRYCGGRFQP